MRALIIRLSSMGDLIHSLPALTDAAKSIPGIRFDWLVDEAFAEIPKWHPAVEEVIATPPRGWTHHLWRGITRGEFRKFYKAVRSKRYDFVIDIQGEWKSAFAARLAKGICFGYNKDAVHEWGAQICYQKKIFVPKQMHAIQRMRHLLAQTLGYSFSESEVDYGIDLNRLSSSPLELQKPYLVFIHSTSWASKCWPESYWQELVAKALESNFRVVLPWGTSDEERRAERIAAGRNEVSVLQRLTISEKASIIAAAYATVGCDTGLSHIAAALDVPSISIYGATDPALIGATGKYQIHIASDFECIRCHQSECTYLHPAKFKPACLVSIEPGRVWQELETLMSTDACSRM